MKKLLYLVIFLTLSSGLFAQNNTLNFDGSNDYVEIPDNDNLDLTGDYTIEAWIYPRTFGPGDGIVSKYQTGAANGLILRLGNTYNVDFAEFQSPSNLLIANTWQHVAGVISSGVCYIYINGVLQASSSTYLHTQANSDPVRIGCDFSNRFFDGLIDEVRIWNDARSEVEIRQNMYRELPDPSSESNLVAYYQFNETSGTTLPDVKNSFNGTLYNIAAGSEWQTSPAMFGPKNALDFDGSYDHVEINNLHLSGSALTVESWVYPRSFNSPSPDANVSNLFRGGNEYVVLRIGDYEINDQPEFVVSVGGTQYKLMADNVLSTDTWYHLAGVYDGNTMKLYINGILAASQSQAGNINTTTEAFALGGELGSTPNRCFDGLMDEVRIWNVARTGAEIRENMCKTLNGNETGLLAYYNFDNTTGTTLQDISGNNNEGTLTNMDENTDWVASTAFNTWLNTSSSSWTTASNWSRGSAPASTDNIGIFSYSGGTSAILSGSPTINQFALGSASSLTLTSGATINGNLILESDLDLNGQNITLGGSATLIESQGRLFGSNGSISTTRNLNNINENVAGLGAEITTAADMGSTVITRGHSIQIGNGNQSIERYYTITPTNNSGLNATLTFHYNDLELNSLTESNLLLYKSDDGGSTWSDMGGALDTDNNTLTLTSINDFSLWTAGGSGENALPVELSSFSGLSTSSGISLNWVTQTETNNAGFILFRNRVEIATYQNTDALRGQGSTSQQKNYQYTDADVALNETYSYELISVDYSGERHTYAKTVEVTVTEGLKNGNKIIDYALNQNYPNPFNPSTTISFTMKQAGVAILKVHDILGRNVFEKQLEASVGRNTYTFNAQKLTSGIYFYNLTTEGFSKTMKMMLVK